MDSEDFTMTTDYDLELAKETLASPEIKDPEFLEAVFKNIRREERIHFFQVLTEKANQFDQRSYIAGMLHKLAERYK